jgi:hypothetical protein
MPSPDFKIKIENKIIHVHVHAMKMYLGAKQRSGKRPGRFTPGKEPPVPIK